MDIQITQTSNTIQFLRIADVGGVISEVRFNAASTSISVEDETFKLITSDRFIEVFEWSDVSAPANSGVQSLLTILNSYIPASGGGGGGTINGTISATQVGFGTALDTIGGDPSLAWDNTNKRLGIGTATPKDDLSVEGSMLVDHTAVASDDHAIEIDVDAAGNGDVKAVDVVYVSGSIGAADEEGVILVNVDETDSTGGNIVGYEMISTSEGSSTKTAVGIGIDINPINQQSGTFGDMDQADVDGVDELADLINPAVSTNLFVLDNDDLVIGDIAKFEEMEVLLSVGASNPGISPVFEYSTGVGTWSTFSPIDGTNAFRNSGVILWDDSDLAGWATGTGGNFLIRITRTRNSLVTTPVADLIQISAVTIYSWDKDAKLNVSELGLDGGFGNIRGIGSTATRNALSPAPVANQSWINTDHGLIDIFDGDLWLNHNQVKVVNQTGGAVTIGEMVKLDGTQTAGVNDVIYTGSTGDSDWLGVVSDGGGTYANGDFLAIARSGTYKGTSATSITTGDFIRSLTGGGIDSSTINSGTFGQAVTSNGGSGTFDFIFIYGERF